MVKYVLKRTVEGSSVESFFIEVDKYHYGVVIQEGFWSQFPDFNFSRIVVGFVLNCQKLGKAQKIMKIF